MAGRRGEKMYYVYIIRSLKDGGYYIGYTNNLERRLQDHNRGKCKSVKYRGSFELVCKEGFETKLEACRRERQIKRFKGGEAFKKLINCSADPVV